MAINDAYATATEYRAAIEMTDTGKDAGIEQDLAAISRYLDRKLRRVFAKDETAAVRLYVPENMADCIWTDDMAAPPELVKVDTGQNGLYETTLAAADYELLPFNADKQPEPWPYTRIQLTPWGAHRHFTPRERVQVTAIFGWPEVPAAIKSATIQLTAILRLETPRATRRIAELGDTVEASPDAQIIVRQLIDQYKVWRV